MFCHGCFLSSRTHQPPHYKLLLCIPLNMLVFLQGRCNVEMGLLLTKTPQSRNSNCQGSGVGSRAWDLQGGQRCSPPSLSRATALNLWIRKREATCHCTSSLSSASWPLGRRFPKFCRIQDFVAHAKSE